MREPPPVEVTSSPGRAWRGALACVAAAAVAAPLGWALPYLAADREGLCDDPAAALRRPAAQAGVALGFGAAAFGLAWRSRRPRRAGALRWDGQDWILRRAGGADERGRASLSLDLGPWMLVRFRPQAAAGRGAWLPFSLAQGDPARWAMLRGALNAGAGGA
jgi:hypothetical protein